MIMSQTQQFSFGAVNNRPHPYIQPQPIMRVNQPCFRVYTQPMQTKNAKFKSTFQKGYDQQEQNKILKSYVSQMENTLKDLSINNKRILLTQQLKENSLMRDQIQSLRKELRVEQQENAYLQKLHHQF